FFGSNEVQIMMRVKAAIFIHDVGFALDIGNEKLRPVSKVRVNAINSAIPPRRISLRTVPLADHIGVLLEVPRKFRIVCKVNQGTVITEWIDTPHALPYNGPTLNILSHD